MKHIGQIELHNNLVLIPKEIVRKLMVFRYGKVPKRKLVRKRRLKILLEEAILNMTKKKKLDKFNKV